MSTTPQSSEGDTNSNLVDKFESFYRADYMRSKVTKFYSKGRDEKSFIIDVEEELAVYDNNLAEKLEENPLQIIRCAEEALRRNAPSQVNGVSESHVRFHNINREDHVGDVREGSFQNFLSVPGTIKQATDVKPKLEEAAFECQRCGTMTYIPQTTQKIQEPHECQGCERQGPFRVNYNQSQFVDAQQLLLRERQSELTGGMDPSSIRVLIEDDECDKVTAGDEVTINGVLQFEDPDDDSRYFDTYLDGNAVIPEERDFTQLETSEEDLNTIQTIASDTTEFNESYNNPYDILQDCIAPSIWGYEQIKKAIVLLLFSGVRKIAEDGTTTRGDFHMLLIGDPGTAKSSLIQYIENIAPLVVTASGKGSSGAGLTASAVRSELGEGDQWTLSAGALPLADKGIAAIDELDKMREEDRSSLHEGLEQQQVTVNKAGINSSLKTRCAVIAAANPKYGRFDDYETIAEQIELDPALISRFDLIFTIQDEIDEDEDEKLANHVVDSNYVAGVNTHRKKTADPDYDMDSLVSVDGSEDVSEKGSAPIQPELVQKYIAHAKQNVYPVLSQDARQRITKFYVELRQQGKANEEEVTDVIPITARKLEALVRLTEASARVRLASEATVDDVERVIQIVKKSLEDVSFNSDTDGFDADMIESKQSATQRKRKKSLKAIIREMTDQLDDDEPGVKRGEVMAEATQQLDVDLDKLKKDWDKMRKSGELYEPTQNKFRLT